MQNLYLHIFCRRRFACKLTRSPLSVVDSQEPGGPAASQTQRQEKPEELQNPGSRKSSEGGNSSGGGSSCNRKHRVSLWLAAIRTSNVRCRR